MVGEIDPSVVGVFALIMILFILFVLIAYVYQALALYYIARKTKTPNEWLAWIPIGNMVLMANIAKMHWWPVLLYIPAIFFMFLARVASIIGNTAMDSVFSVISYSLFLTLSIYVVMWLWKIYEKVSRPGYWSIIPLVISIISLGLMILGLVLVNITLFWLGITGIIVGVVQQHVYMGLAAWHKNSIVKKIKDRGG
mgnify:CR=1 FL=1